MYVGCMCLCVHMHVCLSTCLFPSVKVISVNYYAQHCFEFGESRD